ncbi:glycine cleavage system protein GcvH [Cylindrospermopsis curvispora]|uniref:Glycine cleavage system H protein n=1 Tax=Cylindrospermopsis curvispora GIHE-G1 TaxID=2666332 RepID=A0A7H0F4P3_9CYAN|nr:glycine cleavage system protein GcvH [Cylindrospermopsis curvispora]QNP31009.1 glycine cleavage system protein GcvH [Cylindrospermopsis curvispora GIHE-G1]
MELKYPEDLRYLDSHEYVRIEGEIATVGITDFAIDQLGDIVFLELTEVGNDVSGGESFGTIESVKAVEELKSPVTGVVIERNESLIESPESIGNDPYGNGWFIKVHISNPQEVVQGMTAGEYAALVEGA